MRSCLTDKLIDYDDVVDNVTDQIECLRLQRVSPSNGVDLLSRAQCVTVVKAECCEIGCTLSRHAAVDCRGKQQRAPGSAKTASAAAATAASAAAAAPLSQYNCTEAPRALAVALASLRGTERRFLGPHHAGAANDRFMRYPLMATLTTSMQPTPLRWQHWCGWMRR